MTLLQAYGQISVAALEFLFFIFKHNCRVVKLLGEEQSHSSSLSVSKMLNFEKFCHETKISSALKI